MIEENQIAWKLLRQDYIDVVCTYTNFEHEWLYDRELVVTVDRAHYGDVYFIRMSFMGSVPQGTTTFEACTQGDSAHIMARHYGGYKLKPVNGLKKHAAYVEIMERVKGLVYLIPSMGREIGNIILVNRGGEVTVK